MLKSENPTTQQWTQNRAARKFITFALTEYGIYYLWKH